MSEPHRNKEEHEVDYDSEDVKLHVLEMQGLKGEGS